MNKALRNTETKITTSHRLRKKLTISAYQGHQDYVRDMTDISILLEKNHNL